MIELTLGTAQWGSGYGATFGGVLAESQKHELLAICNSEGILAIDTAATPKDCESYGDAEEVIGKFGCVFSVTSKGAALGRESLTELIVESKSKLRASKLQAFLVHDWNQLNQKQMKRAVDDLQKAKDTGLVERVGISAYSIDEIESACELFDCLDVLQIPISALDQRLVDQDLIRNLATQGCQIQARSIFLQGHLLNVPTSESIRREVQEFRRLCRTRKMTPLEGAIDFIKGVDWLSACVVGMDGARQWKMFIDAWRGKFSGLSWQSCASHNLGVIDPRKW